MLIHGNIETGSGWGFGGMDDDSVVEFNTLIDNGTAIGVGISDPNAFTRGNMTVRNNTIVNPHRAVSVHQSYAQDGGLEIEGNVFVMDETLGLQESAAQMVFAYPYVDRPAQSPFSLASNCYFAPNDDAGFRYGPAPAISFADWIGLGFDIDSVWGDPLFGEDDFRVSAASPCGALDGVGAW